MVSKLVSKLTDFLSSPSYIIIKSLNQYLWNGMFDRHQAEITVMQFTGLSLPVHQSMTVPWDFTLSHFVRHAISSLNCHRNVSLPLSLEWHIWPGQRFIYNSCNHINVQTNRCSDGMKIVALKVTISIACLWIIAIRLEYLIPYNRVRADIIVIDKNV